MAAVQPVVSNLAFEQNIGNFSVELYKASTTSSGNEIISPYSVCSALLLLTLGTGGSTKNQMISTMFKNPVPEDVHLGYKTLNDKLKGRRSTGNSLLIANRLFISNAFTVLETYKHGAVEYYNATTTPLDFSTATHSEQSRGTINTWIDTNTKNKIRNMIPQGVINANTIAVLVNAIYFKGTWKTKFDPVKTKKRNFYVKSKDQRQVDMMYGQFKAKSGENLGLACKILQLPYVGETLSMVFLLPNAIGGLSNLQSTLSFSKLKTLLSDIQMQDTIIGIPKFKIEAEYDLQPILKSLGMQKIFDHTTANFTNMVLPELNRQGVYVSDARHKAFLEVTEEGSEAAAATTLVVSVRSLLPTLPFEFVADRPFMFVILDDDTGTILFMGKYVAP